MCLPGTLRKITQPAGPFSTKIEKNKRSFGDAYLFRSSGTPIRCEWTTNPVEVDSLACSAVGPYVAGCGVLPSHGEPCCSRAYFVGLRLWHRSLCCVYWSPCCVSGLPGQRQKTLCTRTEQTTLTIGSDTGQDRVATQAVKLAVGTLSDRSYSPIYILCKP